MHRFFSPKSSFGDGSAKVTGDNVSHITRVLRLKENDSVILCDGEKTDYYCTISHIEKDFVDLKIDKVLPNIAESDVDITLYQCLPKSDKMDFIIQKSVELGVNRIVPVESSRCVAKIKDDEKKRARWQKIAEEAAKQCGRGIIPQVLNAMSFDKAILQNHDLKIMPYECEEQNNLSDALNQENVKSIGVFIGPEGGFEESEAKKALGGNVKTVTLGKRILRCETAGIATVSAIMYAFDQWNI